VKRRCGKSEGAEGGEQRGKVSVLGAWWATCERTKKWEASWAYLDSGFETAARALLRKVLYRYQCLAS